MSKQPRSVTVVWVLGLISLGMIVFLSARFFSGPEQKTLPSTAPNPVLDSSDSSATAVSMPPAAQTASPATQATSASKAPLPTASQTKGVAELFQADDDPETAQQVIAYVEQLAPKMEAAEKSLEKATELLGELNQCIHDKNQHTPAIVQALCLSTAEELADMHPELKDRYEELKASAPEHVTELLKDTETID